MNEHPLFVPFEEQHLAAVVTVPDGHIRGLAVLLQGLGAPRSHRYGLWTRTARSLADRDIASVRFDYPELGDSTGTARLAMHDTPLPQATAVVNTVREALGTREVAATGNCLGAKIALELASSVDGCISVACIIPGSPKALLLREGRTAPHRAARRVSRRMPRFGSFGRKAIRSQRIQPRMHFIPEVAGAMRNADLMFLHLGSQDRQDRLERALTGLASDQHATHRTETWFIPAGNTSGMRLDLDLQPTVIDALVRWIDETLPRFGAYRLTRRPPGGLPGDGVIDLSELRREQRDAWAAGDFSRFATTILIVSESLCEAADLHAGHQVLDVACGSGNTALCAARRWCEVTGLDYVPSLLERAKARAQFEGLDIAFDEGDAVSLPYPDRSFDVVLSTFGVMFVPDQERAAAEMVRVCRPGGTIGMANFTPSSLAAGFFRVAARFVTPPRGVRPPVMWGTEEGVRAIFGDSIAEVRVIPRTVVFRYRSTEHWFEFFRTNFGPIRTVYESLDDDRRAAFGRDLMELVAAANRSDDETMVADVEYSEVLVTTKGTGR